jgi:NADP-dependent 3-hydroxy acid dehydrogenase YdfG
MIPPVKHLDRTKMIQADDVAQAVLYVVSAPATSCPVEITIRPQRTPVR